VIALIGLAALLPVALVVASYARRSLAWGYVVAGSATAAVLVAITANVVGGVGFEATVLTIGGALRLLAAVGASRRRARNLRRRQQRQLARVAAAQRDRVAA
jgi:hypothetical protein